MSKDPTDRLSTDTGTAGAVARPPLLFLAALLLGFALDHLLRLPFPVPRVGMAHWISAINAGVLIVMGIAAFAAGIRNFSRAATPVQGTRPTRALVTTGIHGWSRNPIYLGMLLVYGGIGLVVRSPWILILAAAPGNHDPLRCHRARGGLPGAAVRRRLSGVQGPREPLAVTFGQQLWPGDGAKS